MTDFQRIILHLDMDSFFASVEIRDDPGLLGKPVVVGADPLEGRGRGVVSTASYEARRFGIHSGMPISRAFILCPHAVFIRPHFDLYTHASARVMEIIRSFADRWEQVSIDEAYLDMSHLETYEEAGVVAEDLKQTIKERERLTCSVGIAPTKPVAKIASDFNKPDGLTIVRPWEVRDFLSPLPVGRIPGIGRVTGIELENLGILTIGQLAGYDIQSLLARFGRWAVQMQNLAVGLDDGEVRSREGFRSVSRETTFQEDTADSSLLATTLDLMAKDLIENLVHEHLVFRTVTVKVRYEDFDTHTRSRTLDTYSRDPGTVHRIADSLLRDLSSEKKIRLIGLRLSSLHGIDARQKRLDDFS
ncbi:MAG: DNA polymerase IV [Methanolinea sp. SDB]|nr:MAG: DNA polymerase IV [Methanolinea sp. SDB]